MQTKSNIQLVKENFARKESFRNDINDLMDKYLVNDNIFMMNENHRMEEVINGYFVADNEYTDLAEAVSTMKFDQVIRVIENDRFQVGNVYERLSNVPSDNEKDVYDISTGDIVDDK